MSQQPINLSPDLVKLRDKGYDLEICSGYLVVKNVPYVNNRMEVDRGMLVMLLDLAGDVTIRPSTHVAYFSGDHPCTESGAEITQIKHSSGEQKLADGVIVQHTFSAKPVPEGTYRDFCAKVTTYVSIISGPAQKLDQAATAKTFPVIAIEGEDDGPFHYIDTASSRAGIASITQKLSVERVAIVGLGGTGSYVLDLIAKTPVKEIHLFDGDVFLQHNAFRSPGAPSKEELGEKLPKVNYYQRLYGKMRRGIINHNAFVDARNVAELVSMSFVFLCLDTGIPKRVIVEKLEEFNIPFSDVGMGIHMADDALGGTSRVTMSTEKKRDHIRNRISFGVEGGDNEYETNIQIADLNALNAALAVIKWKKLLGFYQDLKCEHTNLYSIDTNLLLNEDIPA